MKTSVTITIDNHYELARLLNLIEDGMQILSKQDRSQRGIDGYTRSDLNNWYDNISKLSYVRCKYASGDI